MEERLTHLRKILSEQKLDAILISAVPNIYYLTEYGGFSSEERDAYLFVTNESAYLLTNALYIHAVRQTVKHFTIIEQSRDNPLKKILSKIIDEEKIKICGFEDTNLTVSEYTPLLSLPIKLQPSNTESLRIIKNKNEIDFIEKACVIGDQAYEYIQSQLHPGITEVEIAHKLELFIKQQGSDISFRAIVAFGKNAAVPHHFSSNDKLVEDSCVLLDFGAKYQKYCSDMTRTLFVGKASTKHKEVYNTVLEAQQAAIDALQKRLDTEGPEKIAVKDIDLVARNYIIDKGFPTIPHTLGHGIGLEVHEGFRLYKTSTEHFANGMVFSIEPGIYLPNDVGVRIEDLFAIENNTLRQLTHSPRELTEI